MERLEGQTEVELEVMSRNQQDVIPPMEQQQHVVVQAEPERIELTREQQNALIELLVATNQQTTERNHELTAELEQERRTATKDDIKDYAMWFMRGAGVGVILTCGVWALTMAFTVWSA